MTGEKENAREEGNSLLPCYKLYFAQESWAKKKQCWIERMYCPGCKCDLGTEIEDESQRMLHYQEVQIGYAVMSEKKVPGTVCSNGLMLNTNVYGLRTSKVLVYCYNVKVV
uniref:Uncharacterized protein n=1 Tax=Ditylenchus dipsaci TaxID=166011 RepID=A0A915ET34_9BILA